MKDIESQQNPQEHHEVLEKTHRSSRKLGIITILLLFGLFGVWSIFANIATTITASGKVITTTYNKVVTSTRGGMVTKIYVKEGDKVAKDQKLLELDSVEFRADLDAQIDGYDRDLFSICRLEAMADLSTQLSCEKYEASIINKDHLKEFKAESKRLLNSSMDNFHAKIALLKSKNEVYLSQNRGFAKQIASNKILQKSYEKELTKWKKLLKQDAVDELKSIETQRKIEQVKQQIDSIKSKIEENLVTIKSNEQQMVYETETFKNNALAKLNDLRVNNQQMKSKIISLKNRVEQSTIKSPSDGLVIDMKLHAARESVSPYKPILSIVPDDKELGIEAYVKVIDIEKVFKGQKATISFGSFVDPSAVPIEGEVTYISADTIVPEGSREPLYKLLIKITDKGQAAIKENQFNIIPGMPMSAFIKTGETTLMRYLLSPFIQLSKGMFNAN